MSALFAPGPAPALAQLAARGIARVDLAMVLGTGLGGLAGALEAATAVPYDALDGFPRPRVGGHAGRLLVGRLQGRRVAIMQGRAHYYERGDAQAMGLAIKTLAGLGARALILTNAAGSLRPDMAPGSLALIGDHLNLAGVNPLIGDPSDARFVSMNAAYDPALRAAMRNAAARIGVALPESVYAWFSGPSFETPAEVRMAGRLGADLVGMSTVPETLLARRFGLRVAALSAITNAAAGLDAVAPTHGQTQAVAARAAGDLARLLVAFTGGFDV